MSLRLLGALIGNKGLPVGSYRVEAHDRTSRFADLVEVATPDRHGRFSMDLDEEYLDQLFLDSRPPLYFRVFDGERLIASTERTAVWHLGAAETRLRIVLPRAQEVSGVKAAPHVVLGCVHVSESTKGWRITAKDAPARGEMQRLAVARVGDDGRYELQYGWDALAKLGKDHADLVLEVVDGAGQQRYLSEPIFHARPTLVVDFVLDEAAARGPTTFAALKSALELRLGDARVAELTADEATRLGRSVGLDSHYVRRFVAAHAVSEQLARRDSPVRLSPEVCFGLLAGGTAGNAAAVLALRAPAIRDRLRRAADRHLVGSLPDERLARVVDELRGTAPESAADGTRGALHELLVAGIGVTGAGAFLRAWFDHDGDPRSFWARLENTPEFHDPQMRERTQLVLQLGLLTRTHIPLLRRVLADGAWRLRDLARYTEDEWHALVQSGIGVPASIEGKSDEERARTYARELAHAVEAAVPTAVIADRMRRTPRDDERGVLAFLESNPDFEFGPGAVRRYVNENPSVLDVLQEPAVTVAQVQRVQRVFRLTSGPNRIESIRTLLDAGLDSAHKISHLGRQTFRQLHGPALGGRDLAADVLAKANQIVTYAHLAMAKYGIDSKSPGAWAAVPKPIDLFGPSAPKAGLADWQTLFGSLDFCACEHCRSALSPAAYLTDLLHFLDKPRPDSGQRNLLLVLARRRPDIPLIELTCHNTNTALPYIDLVNEVLEEAIAPSGDVSGSGPYVLPAAGSELKGRQTIGGAADLALHPEHILEEAYVKLRDEPYPWTLPFDLWDEEVRAYLKLCGVDRRRLMEVLRRGDPTAPLGDSQRLALAREQLAMPLAELDYIADPAPDWKFWSAKAWSHWNGLDDVSVAELLHRSGLRYEAFSDVLRSAFVNPKDAQGGRVRVVLASGTCDLGAARLGHEALTPGELAACLKEVLARMHRFVRLQHRVGWSAYELDKAIAAFGDTLTRETVARVAEVERLRADLKLPVVEVLAWYALISTDGPADNVRSLYDRLFRNEGVLNPVNDAFRLNDERTELAEPNFPLERLRSPADSVEPPDAAAAEALAAAAARRAAVLGALRVNAAAFDRLLDELEFSTTPVDSTPRMNLENLSRLWRAVSLARALKLQVGDLLSLRRLYTLDPFEGPADTLRFVEEARAARSAPLTVAEIDALLRRPIPPGDDNAIGAILRGVGERLAQTMAETSPVPDPDGQRLAVLLTAVMPDTLDVGTPEVPIVLTRERAVALVVQLVAGPRTPADQETSAGVLQAWEESRDLAWTVLEEVSVAHGLSDAEREWVYDPTWVPELGRTRFDWMQGFILAHLRETLAPQRVVETLAGALGLPGDVTGDLLLGLVRPDLTGGTFDPPIAPSDPAVAVFLDSAFVAKFVPTAVDTTSAELDGEPDPLPAEFRAQARTVRKLRSVASVLLALAANREELAWLFEVGPAQGWLDLNTLPVVDVDDPMLEGQYDGWRRLREVYRLRDELGGAAGPFLEMLRAADASTGEDWPDIRERILATLVDQAGWPKAALDFLVSDGGLDLGLEQQTRWKDERWWRLLHEAIRLVHRTGMPADRLWHWAKENADAEQAREVKLAVRAKYDDETWTTVARPVRDALREKQRQALVAFLIAHGARGPAGATFEDENALFQHYLIDVQMSACAMTSRVREALSAVQLFVQQGMLGLEKGVEFTTDEHDRWEWMKLYRVWEANRKVFLWPENWMEWELRDDKSPFFEELETQLLQSEVTKESAEQAFLEYLKKLDQVARLEVCGRFHEQDDQVDRLHVFARTTAVPHLYFYRVRDERIWGAWQRVDLDIEGDHLLPVVWNRRLHVFWPIFTDEPVQPTDATVPGVSEGPQSQPISTPSTILKVKLAWSQLVTGKWTPRQMGERELTLPQDFIYKDESPEDHFTERTRRVFLAAHTDDDNNLRIIAVWLLGWDTALYKEFHSFHVKGSDGTVASGEDLVFLLRLADCPAKAMFWESGDNAKGLALPAPKNQWTDCDVLGLTPSRYAVGPLFERLPQILANQSDYPTLFYRDNHRTFFIEPKQRRVLLPDVSSADPETIVFNPELIDLLLDEPPLPGPPEEKGYRTETYASQKMIVHGFEPNDNLAIAKQAKADQLDPNTAAKKAPSPKGSPRESIVVSTKFRFWTFYHPHVNRFLKQINRFGIDGLLAPRTAHSVGGDSGWSFLLRQGHNAPHAATLEWRSDVGSFETAYAPTDEADRKHDPIEDIDFDTDGAYSIYNWELFCHAPIQIALRLSQNQRFEEAEQWFHYVFDPTDTPNPGEETPQRFWKVKPLYQAFYGEDPAASNIDQVLFAFAGGALKGVSASERAELKKTVDAQVKVWVDNPFNPFAIARLRAAAFQKAIVLKYLDNLIAWGDHLFRQDTMETINEATLCFVRVAQLLRWRPETVNAQDPPMARYVDVRSDLDDLSNALVAVEDALAIDATPSSWDDPPPVLSPTLYFCIPPNEKLLSYWDKVEDRLFKIRHCMNIDGVVRQLALFDPPIDPAALVRAAAAGMSIASAMASLNGPLPQHRYALLAQKANELCRDAQALGQALLAALEKRDAEALAMLRSTHELSVLDTVTEVRKLQIDEAVEARNALEMSKVTVDERIDYYTERIKEGLSDTEKTQHEGLLGASAALFQAKGHRETARTLSVIPSINVGVAGMGGTPEVGVVWSTANFAAYAQAATDLLQIESSRSSTDSTLAGSTAAHERRSQDWELQLALAQHDKTQVEAQIAAALLRTEIAEKELAHHQRQLSVAKEAQDFLRDKFTNQQLYDWMTSQVSAVYFQAYQLALDMARRAERAWQREVAAPEPPRFIQPTYWDSLRKGLLAGERLALDLKRMEVAYLDQSRREFELTRHVSLAMVDPVALQYLKATGKCVVTLHEALFDVDCPGHYLRRIKSVALSIPCVTGPFTPTHCTLTLLKSSIRTSPSPNSYRRESGDDPRFVDRFGAIQSIVTSGAQNDSGLFETNLRDERYLPFEGEGLVDSLWRLELPVIFRQFDYDTISDVILHLRYTAREGGVPLRDAAVVNLQEALKQDAEGVQGLVLQRVFALRTESSGGWQSLFTTGEMAIDLSKSRFPYAFQRFGTITIVAFVLFLFATEVGEENAQATLTSADAEEDAVELDLAPLPGADGRVLWGRKTELLASEGMYRLRVSPLAGDSSAGDGLSAKAARDGYLVVNYQVAVS